MPENFIQNALIQPSLTSKLGTPNQNQTGECPKIAPSNPLLLKGGRGALLHSYKLAKNTYFALLRVTDIKRSRVSFLTIKMSKSNSY